MAAAAVAAVAAYPQSLVDVVKSANPQNDGSCYELFSTVYQRLHADRLSADQLSTIEDLCQKHLLKIARGTEEATSGLYLSITKKIDRLKMLGSAATAIKGFRTFGDACGSCTLRDGTTHKVEMVRANGGYCYSKTTHDRLVTWTLTVTKQQYDILASEPSTYQSTDTEEVPFGFIELKRVSPLNSARSAAPSPMPPITRSATVSPVPAITRGLERRLSAS